MACTWWQLWDITRQIKQQLYILHYSCNSQGRLDIKQVSYQCRISHYKYNTVSKKSYLFNEHFPLDRPYLYWYGDKGAVEFYVACLQSPWVHTRVITCLIKSPEVFIALPGQWPSGGDYCGRDCFYSCIDMAHVTSVVTAHHMGWEIDCARDDL